MTDYPLRAGAKIEFTPEALKGVETKPLFTLRWANREDRRRVGELIATEGLQNYGAEDFRTEIIEACRAHVPAEEFALTQDRLNAYWQASDDHESVPDQAAQFEHPDSSWAYDVERNVHNWSSQYRLMTARNRMNYVPRMECWFRVLCEGWTGFETPFASVNGVISGDLLDELMAEIGDNEQQSGAVHVELITKAFEMSNLAAAKRKNSLSLAQLPPTPETSQAQDETLKSKNGSSEGSAVTSDAATPKTSSEPTT